MNHRDTEDTEKGEAMPPLRWLVRVHRSQWWDDSIDSVRESVHRDRPVLQYRIGTEWCDVPIVHDPPHP